MTTETATIGNIHSSEEKAGGGHIPAANWGWFRLALLVAGFSSMGMAIVQRRRVLGPAV
jgi:hypothetical protein